MTMREGFAGPFSFNHFCRSPWYGIEPDLPRAIDAAARAGFALFSPDCLSLAAWQKEGRSLAALTRHARDAGIVIGPLVACAMLDGSAAALDGLIAAGRMAGELGTNVLQVNVTGETPETRGAAVATACDRMDAIGPFRLAIEYMPFSGLATLAETLDIVGQVGEARAGAMVDLWHLSHDPTGWEVLAGAPLTAIAYVEIDDALAPLGTDLMVETTDRRTFPGEGILETQRFADLLCARGYQGPVSVEILSRALIEEPVESFAARAYQTSSALFRAA